MSDTLSSLKEEDVRQLALLIESLEQSTFDYLQLEVGDLKVTIGKGGAPPMIPPVTDRLGTRMTRGVSDQRTCGGLEPRVVDEAGHI